MVGRMIAEKCKEKGIETVVFDRGGFKYHGRIVVRPGDASQQIAQQKRRRVQLRQLLTPLWPTTGAC